MATWNLKELRGELEHRFDSFRYQKAIQLLNSIEWKIRAEKYHRTLATEVLQPFFGDDEVDTKKAIRLALSRTEDSEKFNYALSLRQFNLVAAASTAHTTPEIIAQLVALLFSPAEPDVHKISFREVAQVLPTGNLKSALLGIYDSEEYQYLLAFANTIKHVSMVIPQFHISFEEPEYHGVMFKEFEYKGKLYPSKRDSQFLEELKNMSRQFVEVGIQINMALR